MTRPTNRSSRVPDVALSLPALDAAYRVARLGLPPKERSEVLTIALREHFSERDASTKAKWALNRIWFNPPSAARYMVEWALANPQALPDRRLLHGGALIATYPFVGSVAAFIGRAFALQSTVSILDVRRRCVELWGGTSTVIEGASKAITTLRRLELVNGGGREPITAAARIDAPCQAAGWLVHAALLTRQQQAVEEREIGDIPELYWAKLAQPIRDYPLLQSHREGATRSVWAIR